MTQPIHETVGVLEAVAAGDLTKRLHIDSQNEVGRMAVALNIAVDSLRNATEQRLNQIKKDQEQAKRDREQIELQNEQAEKLREMANRERQQANELKANVESLLKVVNAATEGDLTKDVTVLGEDSLGQMGQGFDRFVANLRHHIA